MKRKSFTNYKKAGLKKNKPADVAVLKPRMNMPYRSISLQPEVKFFDTASIYSVASTAAWTGSEVTNSSYIQDDGVTVGAYTDSALNPSANGPGYGEVLGGKYRILKIRVRGHLSITVLPDQADVSAGAVSRVCLVMDVQAGGAQLQGEQVFTDLGGVNECCYSFQQQGQATDKYRVLKDVINQHDCVAVGTDGASTNSIGFTRVPIAFTYVPKEPLIVNVLTSGSTPSIAQIKDVNIFMLARASAPGSFIYAARCYYTDT